MINIQLPVSLEITVPPWKPFTIRPDENDQLLADNYKAFAAAVNARVADPTNKSIVITLPGVPNPPTYKQASPFGSGQFAFTFTYDFTTIFAITMLQQLADGINQFWNG